MRPVIGITTYVEPVDRGDWPGLRSAVLPQAYVDQVQSAGGIALLIPPRADADLPLAEAVLARVDGLIIAGGADVEPSRYAARPHPLVQDARPDRDALELALATATSASGLPVLGICRGMQVMAVAAGGSLIQHLPDVVGHTGHSIAPGTYADHRVATVDGTRLRALLGPEVNVPSYHHQAVADHPGYAAAAWAADGTLEAMEDPDAPFRVAVQWHPEMGSDPRLFEALVAAASTGRN
ncbi:MAG TPA: gamma-glutamyl-gamma-aminobutyrate hydrolase family protein [Tetrasphaera sp.]|uniref:gamma-glutamyl-gamma-aminobutyrate hydrolase family protein n=1 Tax=Nostocoides sp. TaxID=1917966 RepID=UPI002CB9AFE4|nr:gamma-glutamyl-gamma-aminobutyrate hydrolase family protein [Tetrasphaera sp.]HNQ06832.1 gamma-glutamyl-gamma-aminobutyrate hydrolase family protein [Tetrasphaera sp.]